MSSARASSPGRLVFRPRLLIVTAVVFTAGLLAVSGWGYLALGEIVHDFTLAQGLTLLLFLVFAIALMWTMALSVVVLDGELLTIRNGLRRHRLPVAEITALRYRPGDSWCQVFLTDGPEGERRVQLIAIQRSDGRRAEAAATELRAALTRSRAA